MSSAMLPAESALLNDIIVMSHAVCKNITGLILENAPIGQ